jgi:hypothetical protein
MDDVGTASPVVRQRGAVSERELQQCVIRLAALLGWSHFHPYDSRRSNPGWPDLAIWRPGRFLLRELKSARGRVSRDQQVVIAGLEAAGVDVGVWWPVDWLDGTIERELRL